MIQDRRKTWTYRRLLTMFAMMQSEVSRGLREQGTIPEETVTRLKVAIDYLLRRCVRPEL